MRLRGKAVELVPRRILLLQLRRIGDTLLGTPAIRALRKKFPDAKIDFLVEQPAHETLIGHPEIDRLLIAPRGESVRAWIAFVRQLRQKRYDWAIDFLSNPRSAQFTFLSGARIRVGLDRFGRRWAYTHRVVEDESDRVAYAVDLRLGILGLLGVSPAGRNLEIYCDETVPAASEIVLPLIAATEGRLTVAIAAGSANPAKRYPVELTADVIRMLYSRGIVCILTSGPGETEFADAIVRQLNFPQLWLQDAHVPALAALYRRVSLYIGPDSGTKHIAVACGIPTVTVFGPGCPSNWNDPLNDHNIVLVAPCDIRPACIERECALKGDLKKISPGEVVAAAIRLLPEWSESR